MGDAPVKRKGEWEERYGQHKKVPTLEKKPVEERIKEILDDCFWLPTLKSDENYFRTHDDCDGDLNEGIGVAIDMVGDVWIQTHVRPMNSLRFRMPMGGGGRSHRVRNALLILAEAIRLDNADNPII